MAFSSLTPRTFSAAIFQTEDYSPFASYLSQKRWILEIKTPYINSNSLLSVVWQRCVVSSRTSLGCVSLEVKVAQPQLYKTRN